MQNELSAVAVLIPAYCPDELLLQLLDQLKAIGLKAFVVDDGSGAEFDSIFQQAQGKCDLVMRYPINKGKGGAIKYGISQIVEKHSEVLGIITADADGQHAPEDILHVAEAFMQKTDRFIIGGRSFDGQVPLKSRLGNTIIRGAFTLASGCKIKDTQTGLRALPTCFSSQLLALEGERYEYEMNMLLSLRGWGADYLEVPIQTIYLDENKRSHFNPVRDALVIFGSVLRFALASIVCFLIDNALFAFFVYLIHIPVGYSYVLARICSATTNFVVNKHLVFRSKSKWWTSLIRYAILAGLVMIVGSLSTTFLVRLGMWDMLAKILVDTVLFFSNYWIQKRFVFANKNVIK